MITSPELLARLIAFDTVSARSNLALIDWVEAYLRARAFRVTRYTDPTEAKAGLFASIGPAGAGMLLSAHSDVVPVEGQIWTRDPFRLSHEHGRYYGRGTTDMKGFLASMLVAADRAAGMRLNEPLKLMISYDEEVGCTGIAKMIGALSVGLGQPRGCIVGEPTQMQVAIGHKGKRAFRAVCTGQSGHSALAPHFVNALHLATDVVQALRGLQERLARDGARDDAYDVPYTTVHAGMISAGHALNIVADRADVTYEFRHLSADPADALEQEIAALAARIAAAHGPRAAIEILPLAAYPGLDTAPDAEVVALMCEITGARTTRVAFGTEAGFFAGLGIPTVVCGPGSMEGQGHRPDEYLEADQLAACDEMLGRVLTRLC